jgi:surface antigen
MTTRRTPPPRRRRRLAIAVLTTAGPVDAQGYPYDHATDCSSQYGASSWCIDTNHNNVFETAEQYSPYGFSYRNCTDYVAWRINSAGVTFTNTMGGHRFSNAVNNSGHVALVESVNANGTVNGCTRWAGWRRCR